MIRRPPRSTLFPTRRSSDLRRGPHRSCARRRYKTGCARSWSSSPRRCARRCRCSDSARWASRVPRLRSSTLLPAVVREGLVGLRHAVRVFALPDGRAAILGRFHQLVRQAKRHGFFAAATGSLDDPARSEEHTSELQSQSNLVCRLLLENKKKKNKIQEHYQYKVCQ